jgi:hypothetical protein
MIDRSIPGLYQSHNCGTVARTQIQGSQFGWCGWGSPLLEKPAATAAVAAGPRKEELYVTLPVAFLVLVRMVVSILRLNFPASDL